MTTTVAMNPEAFSEDMSDFVSARESDAALDVRSFSSYTALGVDEVHAFALAIARPVCNPCEADRVLWEAECESASLKRGM
jgi:hypothetical protein